MKMLNLSKGGLVLFYYSIFAYLIPSCLILFSDIDLKKIYDFTDYEIFNVLIVIFVFLISLININRKNNQSFNCKIKPFFLTALLISISQIYLFFIIGINSLRYDVGSYENYGIITGIFYLNLQIINLLLFHTIFIADKMNKMIEATMVLLIIASLFSINGIASILVCITAFVGYYDKKKNGRFLFCPVNLQTYFSVKNIIFVPFIILSCLCLFIIGLSIKEGKSINDVSQNEVNVYFNLDYFAERLSPSIISLNHVTKNLFELNISELNESFSDLICVNSNRIYKLIQETEKYDKTCNTTMRKNYLNIDNEKSLPGGTAPGYIASILYLFPIFPANFLFLFIITRLYVFMYDNLLLNRHALNIFGYLVVLQLTASIIVSIPDLLIILDDSSIIFFSYLSFSVYNYALYRERCS